MKALALIFVLSPGWLLVFDTGCVGAGPKEMKKAYDAIMSNRNYLARRAELAEFVRKGSDHQTYLYGQLQRQITEANEACEKRADILAALCMAGSSEASEAVMDVTRDDPAAAAKDCAATCIAAKWSHLDAHDFPVRKYEDIFSGAVYIPDIVRQTAVSYIRKAYGRNEMAFLASMLADESWLVRDCATTAVGSCGKPEDLQTVLKNVEHWRDRDWSDVVRVCLMLRKITGRLPRDADPRNIGAGELDWWLSQLRK
jgi:hypothetical protein